MFRKCRAEFPSLGLVQTQIKDRQKHRTCTGMTDTQAEHTGKGQASGIQKDMLRTGQ